ncbi:unnamed protein product [Symbiodinium sp. CCMP2592]|nr:unnamed protein product [Symbiodinium sp. CCMP2592]
MAWAAGLVRYPETCLVSTARASSLSRSSKWPLSSLFRTRVCKKVTTNTVQSILGASWQVQPWHAADQEFSMDSVVDELKVQHHPRNNADRARQDDVEGLHKACSENLIHSDRFSG